MARKGKKERTPKDNNALVRFEIRLTPHDAARLRELAADAKVTRTDYLRTPIRNPSRLSRGVGTTEAQALIRSLAAIGNNLNQVTRALNSGDALDGPMRTSLDHVTAKLDAALDSLARLA